MKTASGMEVVDPALRALVGVAEARDLDRGTQVRHALTRSSTMRTISLNASPAR